MSVTKITIEFRTFPNKFYYDVSINMRCTVQGKFVIMFVFYAHVKQHVYRERDNNEVIRARFLFSALTDLRWHYPAPEQILLGRIKRKTGNMFLLQLGPTST